MVSSLAHASLASRAVARPIEAGSDDVCAYCSEQIRFSARLKARKVIANVYVEGRWDRVEQFHEECYGRSGQTYGPARP